MRSSVRLSRPECHALLCGISIWSSLASVPLMRRSLGPEVAASAGFAIAACIAIAYWLSQGPPRERRFATVATVGAVLGALSFPLLCLVVAGAGLLVGLEPMQPIPALRGSSLSWMNALLLAPLFEEVLYRSLLIDLLRPRIGLLGACAVSTALFAASHLSAWGIVSGVVVGCLLAAGMARTRRLEFCMGLHVGLNLASLCLGTPPPMWAITGSLALMGAASVVLLLLFRAASPRRSLLRGRRETSPSAQPSVASAFFDTKGVGP